MGESQASSRDHWLDLLWQFITLEDYNSGVVLLGTVLFGMASGLLGVYLLLRRRALIGDAIAHATLPGTALAFMWLALQGQDKSLPTIFFGAALSGALGGAAVLALRHWVKIREDAALGIVLSVFFGAGVAIRTVVQKMGGNASGLDGFIYGKAASMGMDDVWASGISLAFVFIAIVLVGKELKILCFDSELAASQGWPVMFLDTLLILLVVVVTMVGLQAVGTILVIALLVVPASSARFWTDGLTKMLFISSGLGALSCAIGTMLSATFAKMPSGATIVIVSCFFFAFSFCWGAKRGVIWRLLRFWRMQRDHDFLHLLRAAYEILETRNELPLGASELKSTVPISLRAIAKSREWSESKTRQLAGKMAAAGLVVVDESSLQLTPKGILKALESVREHRLLEMYMVEQAEAAVGEADREADYLEHGLEPEHLAELSGVFEARDLEKPPPSPHDISSEEDRAE
ncbi:MAG: iron chelate uptake ABC transporter family permease subunit [Planctomycetota bacterium]